MMNLYAFDCTKSKHTGTVVTEINKLFKKYDIAAIYSTASSFRCASIVGNLFFGGCEFNHKQTTNPGAFLIPHYRLIPFTVY